MFSSAFSVGNVQQPRIYATAQEAEEAAANDPRQPLPPNKKEEYAKIQRKQRAELILGQYDLLMKYAVENQIVSCNALFRIGLPFPSLFSLTKYDSQYRRQGLIFGMCRWGSRRSRLLRIGFPVLEP